jgi:hypothetical protein
MIRGVFFQDRILYRGSALDLTAYSRAELSGSDHKPGLFACTPNQLIV